MKSDSIFQRNFWFYLSYRDQQFEPFLNACDIGYKFNFQ